MSADKCKRLAERAGTQTNGSVDIRSQANGNQLFCQQQAFKKLHQLCFVLPLLTYKNGQEMLQRYNDQRLDGLPACGSAEVQKIHQMRHNSLQNRHYSEPMSTAFNSTPSLTLTHNSRVEILL
eukprot:4199296-Amphidinium_carterae.1